MTVRAQDGGLYGPADDMPDRLTLQATLVLIAVALGLAFGGAVLVGGGASAAKPKAERGPALVQRAPGPDIDLALSAALAVPALRVARKKGRAQLRRPTSAGRPVTPAIALISAPVEREQPTPVAEPRAQAPPQRRVVATPKPKPAPTPVATPESSGDFDTSGESAVEQPEEIQDANRTAGVSK